VKEELQGMDLTKEEIKVNNLIFRSEYFDAILEVISLWQ